MPQQTREINKLCRDLASEGFKVEPLRRHIKVTAEDGRWCVISASPGDGRAFKNTLALLVREVGYARPEQRERMKDKSKKIARTA